MQLANWWLIIRGWLASLWLRLPALGTAIASRCTGLPRLRQAILSQVKWPQWGLPKMGPQLYLLMALAAGIPATYGVMWVKQQIAVKHAYADGKRVGAEQVAATVAKAARERVAAVERGEREAETVPVEKAKIVDLCKRSASCRDRGR